MKKSFIIHIDSLDVIDDLSDEQCGELLRAFKAYHSESEIELSPIVKVAFSPFKNQFERDLTKYNNVCERNKVNGSKGGRPKKPTGLSGNPKEPRKADNDSKNDSDSDKDNKKKKGKTFSPPEFNDVCKYISEKQYQVSPNQFMNHYESNGWKVGKNSMKDWKAAVRTWHNRNKENETNRPTSSNQQSKAGRVSDRLDEIARKDIEENGFAETLDSRNI